MKISRVQIEEGFLDGIDLSFVDGLNVVIGARGTGKTSLIELIRYCLNVPGFSDDFTRKSYDHARAVLGSGQISVSLSDAYNNEVIVSRSYNDHSPRATGPFVAPMIFSQTEIENLGLLPESRLKLIDGFIENKDIINQDEEKVCSQIASYTVQIASEREEIDKYERQLSQLPAIDQQLLDLAPQEKAISQISDSALAKSQELAQLTAEISKLGVVANEITRFQNTINHLHGASDNIYRSLAACNAIRSYDFAELSHGLNVIAQAAQIQQTVTTQIQVGNTYAMNAQQRLASLRLEMENRARVLRREVDQLKEGSGAVARQGQTLRERRAQIASCQDILDQHRVSLAILVQKRGQALDKLDDVREKRYIARKSIIDQLNKKLAPNIIIHIERAGQLKNYTSLIISILRGSGLRYNDFATSIASNVSPRELLEWAEEGDVESLAAAARIAKDRSARVLAAIRSNDLRELPIVNIEDGIRFCLLDGSDFKNVEMVSTGQRCTVVLPIILEQQSAPLIIDQPEDHIDNAFIASTLIKSIRERPSKHQVIVTTHNANIPVLGDASEVIQLGSDGRRGYVIVNSGLSDAKVVKAISNVMEGGAAAFQQRAQFYKKHQSNDAR